MKKVNAALGAIALTGALLCSHAHAARVGEASHVDGTLTVHEQQAVNLALNEPAKKLTTADIEPGKTLTITQVIASQQSATPAKLWIGFTRQDPEMYGLISHEDGSTGRLRLDYGDTMYWDDGGAAYVTKAAVAQGETLKMDVNVDSRDTWAIKPGVWTYGIDAGNWAD
ncbi:hypothetical protein [Escherichia coli]|uniref:hypothetical protein n=1 Tax=Escherichia coli TaxID=562 RepID=UPI0038B265D7